MNIRPNVLNMIPYSPGKPIEEVKRELGLDHVVKLASNENPLGPSPKAVAAVAEMLPKMHLYPDGAAFDLRKAIADKHQLPMNQVVVGNGSDEIIHLLGQIFLGNSEDEIIVGNPSFARYDAASGLADCQLVKIPLTADQRLDLVATARAVTANTKLIFIANPNNPTGTIVTKQEVETLLSSISQEVIVVLDEAYFEFAQDAPDFPNSLDFVTRYPNVVGMRTFSKAYGLAGIRVGYAFVPPQIADAIDRAREPFNVNILAQAAAIAALEDTDHLNKTIELNQRGLDRLESCFTQNGGTPFKSYANFVMADIKREAKPVFEQLLQKGIITRSGHVLGMPNALRVSVGTDEEIDIFIEEFSKIMANQPVAV
jgi:histidinol-phosphate aminotransferase